MDEIPYNLDEAEINVMAKREEGISVIVCCYNSENRIAATLQHLAAQQFETRANWEIILINNNSSDSTVEVAKQIMADSGPDLSFKVVDEHEPGLSKARNRGFTEAKFDLVLMVDDDNSLCQDYVWQIHQAFRSNPELGMVGGKGIPALESERPQWFEKYAYCFAVGEQLSDRSKQVEHLYGAGLGLRMRALEQIRQAGFESLLSDRTGNNLMSGGDTELCYVFRMAGYKLRYLPNINFQHHLPAGRVSWKYLRRLFDGFGRSKTLMELYTAAIAGRPKPVEGKFPLWFDRAIYLAKQIIPDLPILLRGFFQPLEGNDCLLVALAKLGQLKMLILIRNDYRKQVDQVYALNQNLRP